MKTINKTTFLFNLIAFVLAFCMIEVKATDIKSVIPASVIFQQKIRYFGAKVLDENGNEMIGAIGRIKGREEQELKYGQTSGKGHPIMVLNYPVNAIIVISKPGYVTQEFRTAGIPEVDPNKSLWDQYHKLIITVKMVPVKKGSKASATNKKKA